MEDQTSDVSGNGKVFNLVEGDSKSPDVKLGPGNRFSSELQPAILTPPPEQFGRGTAEQRDKKPEDQKKREQSDNKKDENENEKDNKDNKDEKPDEKKPQGPPFYKRPLPMVILIGSVLVLAVVAVLYWLHARQYEETDDAFIEGHVTPISPKVAALVQDVKIDDNNFVHQGQLLVQLDPRDYESALRQAKANESSMRGKLSQAKSNLEVSQAAVTESQAEETVAQVNFENADRDYKRYLALDERATSKQQIDNVTATERSNEAQVTQAKAKVIQMQAQVTSAQSQIETAQADVDRAASDVQQAELNLSYCTILSPQDGFITRKNVEPGSYVQTGQVLFSTVPTNVWVTANFKETQLDMMRPGQPVDVHVDAYPDKTFHGKVDSIEAGTGSRFSLLPAENATGNYVKVVQRVPVKIIFDEGETKDRDHILGVGMSVEPEVKIR